MPYVTISWLLYALGVSPSSVLHYGMVLITPPGTIITTLTLLLGLMAVTISGILMGIILVLIYRLTGSDFPLLKSIGLSLILWIVHCKIIPSQIEPELLKLLPPSMLLHSFLALVTWGIAAGFVFIVLRGLRVAPD